MASIDHNEHDPSPSTTDPSSAVAMSDNTLCWDCARTPWENLLPSAEPLGSEIPRLPKGEHCRACRFFREVRAIHSLDYWSWRAGPPKPYRTYQSVDGMAYVSIGKPTNGGPHFITTELPRGDAQGLLRHLYPSTIDTGLVRRWISECEERHTGLCKLEDSRPLQNLKVIDCRERKVIAAPQGCDYVALSYVWGKAGVQEEGSYVLSGSVLPQTIEDSIELTLSLGYEYLWVDRYCIDQNNAAEKQEQIMQMAQVYETAHLTLIATAGKDPSYGLPGVRTGTRDMPCEQVGPVLLIPYPESSPMYDISDSQWASRAWTYQECYFSRRRLFFLDRQVVFVCNSCTGNETYRKGDAEQQALKSFSTGASFQPHSGWFPVDLAADNTLSVPSDVSSPAGPHTNWKWRSDKIVQGMTTMAQYTKRTLTHQSDAFKAIAGALNTFARHDLRHVWGVPFGQIPSNLEENFYMERHEIALAWYHASPCLRRSGFPSWSPLGWIGPISWYQERHAGDLMRKSLVENPVTVKATGIDLVTENGCFPLSGYVQLDTDQADLPQGFLVSSRTAPLTLVKMPKFEVPGWAVRTEHEYGVGLRVHDTTEALLAPFWDKAPDPSSMDSLKGLLLIGANHQQIDMDRLRNRREGSQAILLILQLCGDHYERVGVVELPPNADDRTTVAFRRIDGRAGAPLKSPKASITSSQENLLDADDRIHATRWWWHTLAPDTVFLN